MMGELKEEWYPTDKLASHAPYNVISYVFFQKIDFRKSTNL